ncbi:hypothetical protein QR680_014635 [Steinernema hermaphroditum]|uniref:C-type lectin domain-containing protein n=1 Tax=Steinernema hermaphroditum TaxID=289476 RepID=A0AA39M4M0_9BILA|nr:hypothetical protein QR680_014635 [Steinernema hermaphroditum]
MRLLLFFFVSFISTSFCQLECGEDGFLSNGDDPTDRTWHCVNYYGVSVDFDGAKDFCEKKGAKMASIHSKYQNGNLLTFGKVQFWIGGRDVYNNGTWTWVDGTRFDFSSWGAGEPNNMFGHDCLMVDPYSSLWSANDCTTRRAAVACMAPFSFPSTTSATTTAPPSTSCSNTSCYTLSDGPFFQWQYAENFCKTIGGHLASVHSVSEAKIIAELATRQSADTFWLGGTVDKNNTVHWLDGSPSDFDNFSHPSFPNYKAGGCVIQDTTSEKWMNTNCNKLSYALCAVPKRKKKLTNF